MNLKRLKKIFALSVSMVCLSTFGVASAAYQLSDEVKSPTMALQQATAIGVLKNETPDKQNLPNKDAILIMSFGTTYTQTRQATIQATVDKIQQAHPNTKVVLAFTSHIIIKRVQQKEGIKYPTPEEALEYLKAQGYTRVAMASFDVLPGIEYEYKKAVFQLFKNDFKKMTIGTPMLYWQGQEGQRDDVVEFVNALATQFPEKRDEKTAILLMAHGTPHPANAYYNVLQNRLDTMDFQNVFVYTVEGYPNLEQVIIQLKKNKIKHVILMPTMMVAGDHANNDMAGDEEDSHKSILLREGFTVDTYLHGLGENAAVRDLIAARAEEAWKVLQAE